MCVGGGGCYITRQFITMTKYVCMFLNEIEQAVNDRVYTAPLA